MTPSNVKDIIGAGLHEASPDDSTINHIVWERTAYPFKRILAKELYRAANRLKRASDNGVMLCDFCDNKAGDEKYICNTCSNALKKGQCHERN